MASFTTAILSMLVATVIATPLIDKQTNKNAESGYQLFSNRIAALNNQHLKYRFRQVMSLVLRDSADDLIDPSNTDHQGLPSCLPIVNTISADEQFMQMLTEKCYDLHSALHFLSQAVNLKVSEALDVILKSDNVDVEEALSLFENILASSANKITDTSSWIRRALRIKLFDEWTKSKPVEIAALKL